MMVAIIVIYLTTLAGAVGFWIWNHRSGSWLAKLTARRVIVHTTEGQSIEGLLLRTAPDGIMLAGAIYMDGGNDVQLGGDVWVPRAKVAFIQVRDKVEA